MIRYSPLIGAGFAAIVAAAPLFVGASSAWAKDPPAKTDQNSNAAKADKGKGAKAAADAKKDGSTKADSKKADAKKDRAKTADAKKDDGKKPASDKPVKVATSGDWGAYTSGAGKTRTCYALSEPRDRAPASLKRDKGYLFISNRPGESVKNEVAFDVGFDVKPNGPATAEIGSASFDLVAKGSKLWIKNAADEPQFVEALRKGQKLVVKAQSMKGNASSDSYALAGVGQILDRAAKDCQ
jgi:hypothetical protein